MSPDHKPKDRPVLSSEATPDGQPAAGRDLPLPHERDASTGNVAAEPNPKIERAKKDLDEGQVDTDMWGTPGLDNARKQRMVPNTKPQQ